MRTVPVLRNLRAAFTLIELLVVIAIIGILAALLAQAVIKAKIESQRKLCQTQEVGLVTAIGSYFSTYGRLPVSTNAINAASNSDFVYGTSLTGSVGELSGMPAIPGAPSGLVTSNSSYQNNNSELIAILRDDDFYPETIGGQRHIYNPQQTAFYTGTSANGPTTTGVGPGSPGIGSDDIWRDFWGLPYIVTVDLSGDNRVFDPYLSQMYQNQFHSAPLLTPGSAVVWSFGPTRQINLNLGSQDPTNKGVVTSY
jgi:prepilin-type N-terminal cleavage/methylation domain-containing protein